MSPLGVMACPHLWGTTRKIKVKIKANIIKSNYVADAFKLLEDLKSHVRPDKKEMKLPHWGRILVFPDSPSDLLKDHPSLYETAYPNAAEVPDNGPMKCPVDEQMLAHLTQSLPARKSHRTLRLMQPPLAHTGFTGFCATQTGNLQLQDPTVLPKFRPQRDVAVPGP